MIIHQIQKYTVYRYGLIFHATDSHQVSWDFYIPLKHFLQTSLHSLKCCTTQFICTYTLPHTCIHAHTIPSALSPTASPEINPA